MGGAGANLRRRKALAQVLSNDGFEAFVPEDDPTYQQAAFERFMLREPDLDLLVLFPESPGSYDEYGTFAHDPEISSKLRVVVPAKYHPIYGKDPGSYLSSDYMTFIGRYGHCYPSTPEDPAECEWSDGDSIVRKITQWYRTAKATP